MYTKHLISFILLLSLCFSAKAQEKEVLIPFDEQGAKKEINIWIYQGDIQVLGKDRKDVLLKYEAKESKLHGDFESFGDEKAKGLKKISHNNADLDISSSGNVVLIKSKEWKKDLKFYVEVPREIDLFIHYGFGGLVEVEGLLGNVNVESNSGDIFAKNIKGLVNASTNDGDITVSFAGIPDAKSMILSNVSGDIDVSLPAEYKSLLKLKTILGSIYSGFDLNFYEKEESSSDTGKVEEQFKLSPANKWSYAKLNGGGPVLTIQTKGGNIYLRKAD